MLIYTDNSLPDPWLTAQVAIENSRRLSPLVAVQPVYMHPYSVAKMVASLSYFYHRRISLNMVAGGFKNDLAALYDTTPHDRRYDRLVEYTTIIQRLLSGSTPLTFEGEFYRTSRLSLQPSLAPEHFPVITVSGSSDSGRAAAEALGALPVEYPEPREATALLERKGRGQWGIRVGIIARGQAGEAWRIAEERFPPDRRGTIAHSLAMKTSDSMWHHTLSLTGTSLEERGTYWLGPFQSYKTFCPYLVGSYEDVAAYVAPYFQAGCTTLILDVPASQEELGHITTALAQAQESIQDAAATYGA
jgi:alkanesulfonate monooxygenase